jgi:Fur family ferric uptake transcriptional regulator
MDDLREIWLDRLQTNGHRITKPLKILVNILAGSEYILNPTEVFNLAKKKYPKIGLVTVYRSIEKMESAGLIERVHMPDSCESFFQASEGHQHLLICLNCGKAEYFEGENLQNFFQKIGSQNGYQIRDHWLQLFGICENCKNPVPNH